MADFLSARHNAALRHFCQVYNRPTTLQVTPGSQTFLQVQWSPAWEQGYAGGRGQMHSSFFIVTMSPQLAQAYLPTLANLGPR
jgi:hypothetical protein